MTFSFLFFCTTIIWSRTYWMTSASPERGPTGVTLPRTRCSLAGVLSQAAFLTSLVPCAAARLARKTRTEVPVLDPDLSKSGGVTAVFLRLLLPLTPPDGSLESKDGLEASAAFLVASISSREPETCSFSESMSLLFRCYEPHRHVLVTSFQHRSFQTYFKGPIVVSSVKRKCSVITQIFNEIC